MLMLLVPSTSLLSISQAGTTWSIQTVDSFGDVGSGSDLALDLAGNPHISYWSASFNNSGGYDNCILKYTEWTNSTWKTETVTSLGFMGVLQSSLALDSNEFPHMSYFDWRAGQLKYAKWTGSAWNIQTVDSGNVGWSPSIALDSNDKPHISYWDGANSNLKYAAWSGSSWNIQTVDSVGYVGYDSSLALDSLSRPHIAYREWQNTSDSALKYARWTGTSWNIQTVDSPGDVGILPSLALDSSDKPHIVYVDQGTWHLKYAVWTGSAWSIQTTSNVGSFPSLALDLNGVVHLSYCNTANGDLVYSTYRNATWSNQTVDLVGNVGWYSSLALDSQGKPCISYYDMSNGDLKFAREQGGVSYDPGVTVGQYVKYGNYWGIGDPDFISSVTSMDWLKYEVVTVNGKNVTLASSAKLKNGTAAGGGTATYNLEAGTMSTQYANDSLYLNGPIIAGGLREGDAIPPLGYLKVNQTKNVEYFGVSRTVNIVNSTYSDPQSTTNYNIVYDQSTGLMLELQVEMNQTGSNPRYLKYGASVIETNISGSVIPEFSAPALLTLLLFVASAFLMLFRKNRRELETLKTPI